MRYGDSELLKSFRSVIKDGRHGSYLEILQTTFPIRKWSVGTRWEALECYADSELLKPFCSDIHGGLFEILQTTSPLKL